MRKIAQNWSFASVLRQLRKDLAYIHSKTGTQARLLRVVQCCKSKRAYEQEEKHDRHCFRLNRNCKPIAGRDKRTINNNVRAKRV